MKFNSKDRSYIFPLLAVTTFLAIIALVSLLGCGDRSSTNKDSQDKKTANDQPSNQQRIPQLEDIDDIEEETEETEEEIDDIIEEDTEDTEFSEEDDTQSEIQPDSNPSSENQDTDTDTDTDIDTDIETVDQVDDPQILDSSQLPQSTNHQKDPLDKQINQPPSNNHHQNRQTSNVETKPQIKQLDDSQQNLLNSNSIQTTTDSDQSNQDHNTLAYQPLPTDLDSDKHIDKHNQNIDNQTSSQIKTLEHDDDLSVIAIIDTPQSLDDQIIDDSQYETEKNNHQQSLLVLPDEGIFVIKEDYLDQKDLVLSSPQHFNPIEFEKTPTPSVNQLTIDHVTIDQVNVQSTEVINSLTDSSASSADDILEHQEHITDNFPQNSNIYLNSVLKKTQDSSDLSSSQPPAKSPIQQKSSTTNLKPINPPSLKPLTQPLPYTQPSNIIPLSSRDDLDKLSNKIALSTPQVFQQKDNSSSQLSTKETDLQPAKSSISPQANIHSTTNTDNNNDDHIEVDSHQVDQYFQNKSMDLAYNNASRSTIYPYASIQNLKTYENLSCGQIYPDVLKVSIPVLKTVISRLENNRITNNKAKYIANGTKQMLLNMTSDRERPIHPAAFFAVIKHFESSNHSSLWGINEPLFFSEHCTSYRCTGYFQVDVDIEHEWSLNNICGDKGLGLLGIKGGPDFCAALFWWIKAEGGHKCSRLVGYNKGNPCMDQNYNWDEYTFSYGHKAYGQGNQWARHGIYDSWTRAYIGGMVGGSYHMGYENCAASYHQHARVPSSQIKQSVYRYLEDIGLNPLEM